MKIWNHARRCAALLLAAILLLSLAACGGNDTTAATMHLMRTEGEVGVSDDAGKSVEPREHLGLYSGYGVDTRQASYAWINLDDVKLAKMDQNSDIAIRKDGKQLEIEVNSGNLFFNVTKPLADDETMNIRTSTMAIGIRGTCGWVEDNGGLSRVYLLEGKVECSAGEQTVQVSAGEFAELTADGELVVGQFDEQDLPAFVRDEVDNGPDETPDPDGSEAPEAGGGQDELNEEEAGELVASGDLGETITWSLRGNTLFIRGTGEIRSPEITYHNNGIAAAVPESFPWYDYREQVHTVIIGNGITVVGTMAFYECSNLTGVTIPNSVTDLRSSVFTGCNNLTSITIPSSVTEIGYGTFINSGLTDIYYGGSESQWEQINYRGDIDGSIPTNATIHYNSRGN